jgi:hypothetical protein
MFSELMNLLQAEPIYSPKPGKGRPTAATLKSFEAQSFTEKGTRIWVSSMEK